MNNFLKTAIASIAVAATTLASLPAADAGERWHRHSRHDGDLAVAGVLGLAAGALIVGLASRPAYREPVYADPLPQPYRGYGRAYAEPDIVYVDDYASLEPWTPQWYAYCSDRYRSFNERTGTFTGFDGRQHFCVAD